MASFSMFKPITLIFFAEHHFGPSTSNQDLTSVCVTRDEGIKMEANYHHFVSVLDEPDIKDDVCLKQEEKMDEVDPLSLVSDADAVHI